MIRFDEILNESKSKYEFDKDKIYNIKGTKYKFRGMVGKDYHFWFRSNDNDAWDDIRITKKMTDILDKLMENKMRTFIEILLEGKGDQKAYQKFFEKMLKKYKVDSPEDLDKSKRKKFFDEVDKSWDAKNETD